MGNTPAQAQKVLNSTLSEKELRDRVVPDMEPQVQGWISMLLSGTTPTNFDYQDMCTYLGQVCDHSFIMVPIWTFNLNKLDTSAKCLVNHWPDWTDDQVSDANFLQHVRVMLPLFKPGKPIGHARFMFYDNISPLPLESVRTEQLQWIEVVSHFVPRELADIIVLSYGGLCPSRVEGDSHHLKIIDSMPGSAHEFQKDVDAFQAVFDRCMDEHWEVKGHDDTFTRKLGHVRAFLRVVVGDETSSGPTLLPSTTQLGLECIIISLCRVIATYANPCVIPLENCQPFCVDKKGRRILGEALSLVHDQISTAQPPLITAPVSVPDVTPDVPHPADDVDMGPTWCVVHQHPSLSILSQAQDYEPIDINFNGMVAYKVYKGCKWVHKTRNQDFEPYRTSLAMDGKCGCVFVCPVRNLVDRKWFLVAFGAPGFALLPARGKTINGQMSPLQDASLLDPPASWSPSETPSDEQFQSFLMTFPDPTWVDKSVSGKEVSDTDASTIAEVEPCSPSPSPTWRRRSTRAVRKPLRLQLEDTTPQKQVVVCTQFLMMHMNCVMCT